MSAMDAFRSTWSQAKDAFGSGVPTDGAGYDNSNQLRQLQSTVAAATPDDRWQGPAADAYAAKNAKHAATFAKLADLDQRMAAEIGKTTGIVTAGRQNLDQLHDWARSAAASVPNGRNAETMRMSIASKGLRQISEIVKQSNDQMTEIGKNITAIGKEYDEICAEKDKKGGRPDRKNNGDTHAFSDDGSKIPAPGGGYGSYHYGYPFSTSENWSREAILKEVMEHYNKYFTFTGDKPNIKLGEIIHLDGPFGRKEPVKVIAVTPEGFSFESLPGHDEGPGRTINFRIMPTESNPIPGRLNWELRVEAGGPLAPGSSIPGSSWFNKVLWQQLADDIQDQLPNIPPQSGPAQF